MGESGAGKSTVLRLLDGTSEVLAAGTITSGFDVGGAATRNVLLPVLDPATCASSQGVTQTVGVATLVFL